MNTTPSRWHARPRNWAIIAAAIAVMVCGVVWPMPVVGAGGALVAAVALVHGIRAFRAEQHPGPAAVVEPATEQPAVRCCFCGAPRVIHQTVTPARLCGDCFLCRCGETPCVRTGINDPAVSSEAARRNAEQWMAAGGARPIAFAPEARELAAAAVARVRALHVRNSHTGTCEPCSAADYPDYAVPWPCPTIRALNGVTAEGSSR